MDHETGQDRTLEQRIRAIEDRLEIYNLIASHPPSADTGADYHTRAVYVEDGVLDLGGNKTASGNAAIAVGVGKGGLNGFKATCGLRKINRYAMHTSTMATTTTKVAT